MGIQQAISAGGFYVFPSTPLPTPDAPQISAAGISGTQNKINLRFTANTKQFELYHADDAIQTNIALLNGNLRANFYVHEGLAVGTTRWYFAKSKNNDNTTSAFSVGASATTLIGHPRKRIRDKIALLLAGSVLFEGNAVTILTNRSIPVNQVQLPAILIYGKTEINDDRETNPKINYPDYQAVTQIMVESDTGDDGQDACDEISNQIEAILGVNRVTLGLADVDELFYGNGSFKIDNTGKKKVLSFIQGWPTRYQKDFPSANDIAAYGSAPDDFNEQFTDINVGDAGLIQSNTDIP